MAEEHLIREFIAEAEELLFALEPNLLRLEQEPENRELINDIFLATHNIKGTAAYVGLHQISSFTHSLESVLDRLRKEELRVSPQLMDVVLEGVDMLALQIRHVASGNPLPDTAAIVEKLMTWQEPVLKTVQSNPPAPPRQLSQSTIVEFDLGDRHLDAEDAEIFTDIARQQLECMRLAFEKLRDAQTTNQPAIDYPALLKPLMTAFRNIQSSAAIIEIDALDAAFAQHARYFSQLEESAEHFDASDIAQIESVLKHLEATTAIISTQSASREPITAVVSCSQPPVQANSTFAAREIFPEQPTLRVNPERVDALLNLIGELVINRARLDEVGGEFKGIYEDLRTDEVDFWTISPRQRKKNLRMFKRLKDSFDEIMVDLGRLTNQLQEGAMRIRMIPIMQVVNRFPRMIRDMSRQSGKDVAITILGAETEVDKTVVDIISDPLIHLVRNALDHGIELPEERMKNGKPRQGQIVLSAYYEGNQVVIEVADDGKGMNIEFLRTKALQKGMITPQEAETFSERDITALIFHSGFSTAETVNLLSGRGVGLNVVKRYLDKINGTIEVKTVLGKGCQFTIKLPLTLAIIPSLMVRVASEVFALPLISVEEAVRITKDDIQTIEACPVIRLRDRMIPLLKLTDILGQPVFQPSQEAFAAAAYESGEDAAKSENLYGVVISDGLQEVGILVDKILGESDIVIKSLNHELVNVEGIAGASIRGDGQVSLVIDPASLIHLAIQHLRRAHHLRGKRVS